MPPLHCAVVAANPTERVVASVVATLRQVEDILVEPAAAFWNDASRWTRADAVIVAANRSTLAQALKQIERVLTAAPYCSIVAVGDGLDEGEMLSLLAAGAFDFVAAPGRVEGEGELIRLGPRLPGRLAEVRVREGVVEVRSVR